MFSYDNGKVSILNDSDQFRTVYILHTVQYNVYKCHIIRLAKMILSEFQNIFVNGTILYVQMLIQLDVVHF